MIDTNNFSLREARVAGATGMAGKGGQVLSLLSCYSKTVQPARTIASARSERFTGRSAVTVTSPA